MGLRPRRHTGRTGMHPSTTGLGPHRMLVHDHHPRGFPRAQPHKLLRAGILRARGRNPGHRNRIHHPSADPSLSDLFHQSLAFLPPFIVNSVNFGHRLPVQSTSPHHQSASFVPGWNSHHDTWILYQIKELEIRCAWIQNRCCVTVCHAETTVSK